MKKETTEIIGVSSPTGVSPKGTACSSQGNCLFLPRELAVPDRGAIGNRRISLYDVRTYQDNRRLLTDGKRRHHEPRLSVKRFTGSQLQRFALCLSHHCHLLLIRQSVESESRHFCCLMI